MYVMTVIIDDIVYQLDKNLMEKWAEREGLEKGSVQEENAIRCVIENAKGRLRPEGVPTLHEIEREMEEIIREEIRLTGGEA